jgi:hypothetical protein
MLWQSCNRPQDKQNIVIFYKELHERFQPFGKKIISHAACLFIGPAGFLGDRFNTWSKLKFLSEFLWDILLNFVFIYLDPISDNYHNLIGPYVEHIVLELSPQSGWNRPTADPVYSFLKIVRMHN